MKTIKIIFSFNYAFIFQYVIFFILLLGGALGEILNVRKDTNLDFIIMFFFSILFVIFYIILVKKILGNWWFTLPIIILSILKIYPVFFISFLNVAIINILIGLFFLLTIKKKLI